MCPFRGLNGVVVWPKIGGIKCNQNALRFEATASCGCQDPFQSALKFILRKNHVARGWRSAIFGHACQGQQAFAQSGLSFFIAKPQRGNRVELDRRRFAISLIFQNKTIPIRIEVCRAFSSALAQFLADLPVAHLSRCVRHARQQK